jgi:hypothetical protein
MPDLATIAIATMSSTTAKKNILFELSDEKKLWCLPALGCAESVSCNCSATPDSNVSPLKEKPLKALEGIVQQTIYSCHCKS